MLLRDRLRERLAAMGGAPDYVLLAEEILGIKNAPTDLARRLVSQALVVGDRRAEWQQAGDRICARAPETAGVYILRDAEDLALYVGKAVNLRRRLRSHFAPRRWKALKPSMARVQTAEWQEVGSELEALLREAEWIQTLAPIANVQTGQPSFETRDLPSTLANDVIIVVPSIEAGEVELVAVRADGPVRIQRTRRGGEDLKVHTARVWKFFNSRRRPSALPLAPIAFSWLAGRGSHASRIPIRDLASVGDLKHRLMSLLQDDQLFAERIVMVDSQFRPPSRALSSVG